jgi:hypothetical protein
MFIPNPIELATVVTHGNNHDEDWELNSGAFESRKIQREVFSPLYNCAPPDKEAIVVRVGDDDDS